MHLMEQPLIISSTTPQLSKSQSPPTSSPSYIRYYNFNSFTASPALSKPMLISSAGFHPSPLLEANGSTILPIRCTSAYTTSKCYDNCYGKHNRLTHSTNVV
ncbi:hypothetical protein EWB00_001021 [Schistosoma japonicum]|uniref:Uncharacterized protein n=1 Tax=Schistosoma japonicum TaxID=6182 RepID=A0A4Z2DHI1_SCHJA|nr:hypothetical protein EWB00_001021 [Schistosoma japonicum]